MLLRHSNCIIERLRNVEIENLDIKSFIIKHDHEDAFMYLDPPYVPSTRRATKAYSYEMTEKEHQELCDLIITCKGKILISGYSSSMYMRSLKEWKCYTKPVANHSGQNKKKEMRIECLWANYA